MDIHPFLSVFDDLNTWQVFASGQAEGRISPCTIDGKPGLRLDYDFHGGGGFVVLRRVLHFKLPDTFKISFHLRGEGPRNHFEFKVVDPGGANVWRHQRLEFKIPETATQWFIRERDLPFAWGPAGGGGPSEVEAVEFVIAAGPGGKGMLELASPEFEDQTLHKPHAVTASSHQPGFPPLAVFEVDSTQGWRSASDDTSPSFLVDFGYPLRFGGLVIDWPESLPPRAYYVEISNDGQSWTTIHQSTAALGAKSHISAPGAEAQHLRITFDHPDCAALCSIKLRPDAFSSTPNEFIHSVAADFPRGWFPRYWHREQSYWTPVGSPEGKRRALINEEGMVEVDEAGFSLEPVILTNGGMVTWAEVQPTLCLPKGGAPMPSVVWKTRGIRLEILPWVDGRGDQLTLHVIYRLKCKNPDTRLVVAVRPFQVNPPWQAFRNLGGRSPIHRISCQEGEMLIENRQLSCTPRPQDMGAAAFDQGGVHAFLTNDTVPPQQQVDDASGLASAAISWELPAEETALEVTVSFPYFFKAKKPSKTGRTTALAFWRKTLGGVQWQVPECARPAFDCFRTTAGHILINRDGPAIQPGPRRYTRSWVRDCVIMGTALAKAGLPKSLHEFLTWYAQFQREDGFIPCVVDRDGVDWLVEHDSHGQFLWGVREVFRNGGDMYFLKKMLPHVCKAADYLIRLRKERMTDDYLSENHTACYGLLPESASHEGYLAHPVHSYWDDFWGVRGLEAAADVASAMDLPDDSQRWKSEAGRFQNDLLKSIEKVIADKQLAYIPGSVEWADFDPTATSNAIAQLDFAQILPQGPLHSMVETYLEGFHRKHRGEMQWDKYTAYEIRIIGAFVRLGKRDEANELLDFFLSDRRPTEWNQWPEITWKNPRSPGHLGDVPHTWIAAEYLLALASMVACEHEADDSMVLASGMPWSWISNEHAFSVKKLPTRHGTLDFKIQASGMHSIQVDIGGTITMPTGGISIMPPLPPDTCICSATENDGQEYTIEASGKSVTVRALPFHAVLVLGDSMSGQV